MDFTEEDFEYLEDDGEFYCEDCLDVKHNEIHDIWYCSKKRLVVKGLEVAPAWCPYRHE